MRIVLDTASLVTALRSSTGAAAEVVRLILLGELVTLMDHKLSLEYRDVALRPEHLAKAGRSQGQVLTLIEALERVAEPVRILTRIRPLSSDPNDDMVLDVAINGMADAVVTNNKRHFADAAARFGILVVSSAELLQRRRRGGSDGD